MASVAVSSAFASVAVSSALESAAVSSAFASVAAKEKSGELRRMGEAARAHVTKSFSLDAFGEKLEGHLLAVARNKQ